LNKTQNLNWSQDKIEMPEDAFDSFSSLQAKIGLLQLKKLNQINKKSEDISKWYKKYLDPKFIKFQNNNKIITHFNIFINNRNKMRKYLFENGINTGIALDYSVPLTKAYRKSNMINKFENSKKIGDEIINLPCYYDLNEKDIKGICDIINRFK